MNRIYFLLIISTFVLSKGSAYCQMDNTRYTISFNNNWNFINEEDIASPVSGVPFYENYCDTSWQTVTLPHTAHIEPLIVTKPWEGVSWYRKTFDADSSWKSRKVLLYFEGAMQTAEVWLNGKKIGIHKGGYLPFGYDISDGLLYTKRNLLVVKLDNHVVAAIPPGKAIKELDFCYYSGIYRNVSLIVSNPVRITEAVVENSTESGNYITFPIVTTEKATVQISTQVINETSGDKKIKIKWKLFDKNLSEVVISESENVMLTKSSKFLFEGNLNIQEPQLWSPENPYLYTLMVEVWADQTLTDQKTETIGIRKFEIHDNTLFLNGKKLKLRGTNRHQEYPYVGNALPDNAQYRDAVKIREAGFNMIRLSHYPQAESFLSACDELGLLVIDCIPGWQFFGNRDFETNSYTNAREMIRRDRNHACVAMWELSINETQMPDTFMINMVKIANEESPNQKLITCGWVDSHYDVFIPARQHAKAPDYWKSYKGNRPIFIAEYGDWEYYAQNAGFNQTDFANLKDEERTSRQLRGYGEKRLLQQALNFQEAHNDNLLCNNMGDANWLMFDYNRGYADNIESSGIMDIFRLPKYAYYFYQSQRPPAESQNCYSNGPMIKIASEWDEQSSSTIKIYSNCETITLFHDDKPLNIIPLENNRFSANLKFPPKEFILSHPGKGQLKAVGYINGKKAAEDVVNPYGAPAGLYLAWDESCKTIGTNDLVFIYAWVVDKSGNKNKVATNKVSFSVEGAGTLVGENPINCEAGVAGILLKTGDIGGKIILRATSDGLDPGFLIINVE